MSARWYIFAQVWFYVELLPLAPCCMAPRLSQKLHFSLNKQQQQRAALLSWFALFVSVLSWTMVL